MTQAADDFALLKTAAHIADGTIDSIAYVAAFNRLFTPRPLRELVAEGYERFWVHDFANTKGWQQFHKNDVMSGWEYLAIPILTPQDMGQP